MEKIKKISLRKQIRVTLLYIYVLIIIASLLLVGLSMHFYQKRIKTKQEDMIIEYSEDISGKIYEMKSVVKQLCVIDKSVRELRNYTNNTDNFESIMELKAELQLSYYLTDCLKGICVYYGYGTNRLYQLDSTIELSMRSRILSSWDVLAQDEKQGINEIILNFGTHHYYVYEMDMGDVSVIGMISLDQELINLQDKENIEFGIFNTDTGKYDGFRLESPFDVRLAFDDLSQKVVATNEKYRIFHGEILGSNLQAVIIQKKSLWTYMNIYHILFLLILLYSIHPFVMFYCTIKRQILEPLKQMTNTMLRIQNGYLENFEVCSNIEEIDEVNKSIESMLKEVMHSKNKMYEAQIETQMAELQYLQLQLRPHFYLNCLKCINGLLMARKYDEIQDYLFRVSFHFRYLMQKSSAFVTVQQEMDFTKNYLQMTKFINPLDIRIAEGVESMEIPILSIQSFVENSVKYAGKNREELMLRIHLDRMKTEAVDYLSIVVADNGKGYPENVLKKINSASELEADECIGIGNLKKRLGLIYAEEAMMYFENRNGAVSQVLLPIRKGN